MVFIKEYDIKDVIHNIPSNSMLLATNILYYCPVYITFYKAWNPKITIIWKRTINRNTSLLSSCNSILLA